MPRKLFTSDTLTGACVFFKESTFFGSGDTPLALKTKPKNSTSSLLNSHFSLFRVRPFSSSLWRVASIVRCLVVSD